jgi:septal ring factor EnvC (AmiA/AmiB activator)
LLPARQLTPIIASPMAALTTDNIGEIILPAIRSVIREEVPSIVGVAIKPLQTELNSLKRTVRQHSKSLSRIETVLDEHTSILDEHSRKLDEHSRILQEHTQKIDRLEGLYEYLEDKFKADQFILKRVVADHSRQLNSPA